MNFQEIQFEEKIINCFVYVDINIYIYIYQFLINDFNENHIYISF